MPDLWGSTWALVWSDLCLDWRCPGGGGGSGVLGGSMDWWSTTPPEGRAAPGLEVLENPPRDEFAHPVRVRRGGRCVELALLVPPNHPLFVDVATVQRERPHIIPSGIHAWPAAVAEIRDGEDVGEEARGLLPINAWELALMARNSDVRSAPKGPADLW